MLLILVFLLVVVPLTELYVIVQVWQEIGVLETLALLVVVSMVGGWVVRREGLGVIRRIQAQTTVGRVPTAELVDGAIIVVAGALLLAPGFITDIVGIVLLIPPIRILVRKGLIARYRRRGPRPRGGRRWQQVVVDVEGFDEPGAPPRPRGELDS
ncbi:MAG TPA: FxsA family protein [Acidimicrobiales bacterium]|jgi:UPF0716 protein FxsA|nr:FxsA family protein [Acidimicrobiales bacterium]